MQELSEEIVLRRMLTAEPAKPTRNILLDNQLQASSVTPRTLSFETERDIVDNLAFLSATSDDAENVTAVCFDEGFQSESCTIRIAMNSGKLSSLAADFRKVARVLERADHKSELVSASFRFDMGLIISLPKK